MSDIKTELSKLIRFVIIGGLGLLFSLAFTYVLTQYAEVWYIWSFIISNFFTWTFIFLGNALYTFENEGSVGKWLLQYASFMGGYLMLFWVNVLAVWLCTSLLGIYYLVSVVIGTVITTVLTFLLNRLLIFAR